MTTHDFDQPYMIYEGEPPRHLLRKASPAEHQRTEEDDDGFDWSSLWIIGAVLAFGVVIGVCGTLTLRSFGPWAPQAATPQATVPAPQLQQDVFASVPSAPRIRATEVAPRAGTAGLFTARAASSRAKTGASAAQIARTTSPAPPKARLETAPIRSAGGCEAAPTRADRAICANPSLAVADQDMRRAYQRALDAGAPPAPLRASQEDWLIASEVAAERSTLDLAAAYSRRIAELNALARREPPH